MHPAWGRGHPGWVPKTVCSAWIRALRRVKVRSTSAVADGEEGEAGLAKQAKRKTGTSRAGKSSGTGRTLGRIALWTVLVVVTAVAMGAAGVGLRKILFTRNPHFFLKKIQIQSSEDVSRKEVQTILAAHGAVPGDVTLFELDLSEIRAALEEDVSVAQAHVSRRLPDTLVVRIFERRPVALLRSRVLRAIDAEGIVLPWTQPGGQVTLPEITGIRNPDGLVPGTAPEDPALLGGLEFLHQIATRPEGIQYDVATIQLDYYLPSLKVHLRQRGTFRDGSVVIVPVRKMIPALDRLRTIVKIRSDGRQTTSYVDVTYEINSPARP
jgi:cell division septal protein FtsQ